MTLSIVTDQIAVDAMMPAPAHPPRLKYLDPRQKVYFFDRCYDLAYNYPDETVETAESFSVFASVSGPQPLLNLSLTTTTRVNSLEIGGGRIKGRV